MPDLSETVMPLDLVRAIDPVCDAFERAWMDGGRPKIEEQLPAVPEMVRDRLLADLLQTELECRCRRGESPQMDEYGTRFPAHADRIAGWMAQASANARDLDEFPTAASTDAPALLRTLTEPPRPAAATTAAVTSMGEYDLLAELGTGGMGTVYRARHRRLGKTVALKVLGKDLKDSKSAATRFKRETEAVGTLDHPNVVEAYDAGEHDGVVYLVMKLIDGSDLAHVVRARGALPIAEACALIRQAAAGLQHLHARGLVHRDIKASNLMVTPEGTVKILDFGLVRLAPAAGADDLTQSGVFMGTPDYVAPEQITDAAGADSRADLYSLGCVLFLLLTGKAPFAGDVNVSGKIAAHQTTPAPDVRTLRSEVPAGLAAVVSRLLAKDPRDRPQTADEVAAALAPWVAKPRRRSRMLLAAAALLALAAIGLGVAVLSRDRGGHGSDPGGPQRQAGNGATHQDTGPRAAALRQMVRIDVKHFANVAGRDQPTGVLGDDVFAAACDDSVTVEAHLPQSAYCYLIAFRPDGTEEVCFPESENERPPLTDRPRYPSVSRGVNYGLNEGAGLQVFAVVVSSTPLPSYKEWRAKLGPSPWKASVAPAHVVSFDDGVEVYDYTLLHPRGSQRGKGHEAAGKTPIAAVTDWLQKADGTTTVAALGFPVVKKSPSKND